MPIDKKERNKVMEEATKSLKKKRKTFSQGLFDRLKTMGRGGMDEKRLKELTSEDQKRKLDDK